MSAKQRHKQRVMKRLKEKLENLTSMEESLHTVVKEHVSKAERRCLEVLQLEDTSVFLQQYGRIEQQLDGVLNFLELLTSSAEDMIENEDHESPDEEVFSSGRPLLSSAQILSDENQDTKAYVDQDAIPQSTKSQVSDEDIKRELKEMLQGSSRKRHSSSEAASQTVVDEMFIAHSDKSCMAMQFGKIEKGNTYGSKFNDMSLTVQETSAWKDFNEPCIYQENAISGNKAGSDQNMASGSLSKKSHKGSNSELAKSVRKTKTEIGVPDRVKKHLNKEHSTATDDSGSSHLDSLAFSQEVTFTSSPKRKTSNPKKKKSPKKKAESTAGNLESQVNLNHTTRVLRTTDVIDVNVTNCKQEVGKFGRTEPDKFVVNKKIVKSEHSEISSEPTINSSEQSILEHELTEMIVSTDSCETSSSSGMKHLMVKDGQVVLYTKQVSSGVTSENKFHSSQKSQVPPGMEHELVNRKAVDSIETKINIAQDSSAENSSFTRENQGAMPSTEDVCDRPGVETDKANDSVLSPCNLLNGRITPVIVSEVVSPWCFFVQQIGSQLNQLMEEICMFMVQGGLNRPPLLQPDVGTLCLAKYSKDNAFYRAYVTQIHKAIQKHASEVDVLYVDYGNRERVKVTHLRSIPEKFKTLPTQAICCALAEVMPCNKYFVWAEDDIHMFRQYVAGQQLSCTPPTCRSSSVSHPLLVELIVSLPVPTVVPGSIYLSQFSVAKLLIKNNKGRHVEVAEQLGLLVKSQEGAEEAAILSHNKSATSRLAIKELSDSHCDPPQEGNVCEPSNRDNVCEFSDRDVNKQNKVVKEEHEKLPRMEQLNLKQGTDVISTNLTSSDNRSKEVRTDLISPRSENSDTESQSGDGLKGTSKAQEKGQIVSQVMGSKGQLDKIKEEKGDLESCETASTTNSNITDLEFLPGKGHLSDLQFDLDDLCFNPQGQEVMLAHVKSPDEFFVHIISQQSAETLDRLMKNLNSLFETANRRKLTRLSKTFEVVKNKLCCAQFLLDNNFYRAIIRSTTPEKEIMKGRVLVHYIDFGDEEWLPKRRIFPIPPQFCTVPRLALKCSLAYIKPVCGERREPAKWSERSVEMFVNIAGLEKTLNMHVVQGSLEDLKKRDPCVDPPVVGILLVDNTGTEEVCVNMDLIRENVAQLDANETKQGLDSTCENSPEMRLEKWNPMQEDFLSKRNSYNIDIDDAGVATTGYNARDEERICKFYSMGRNCWRGERCPYRHVLVESGVTYDQEPVYAILGNQADILPNPGSWVAMEISTILSPSHFYAILPLGNKSLDSTTSEPEKSESAFGETGIEETLDDLLSALNIEYSNRLGHDGNMLLRAIGEIVVARFSKDKNWYRARVIEVTEEKVKVFFVDFGNTEWLPENEIVDIKPEFLHLPFQAIECFMNLEPKGDEKWTKDTRIEFRELVDGKTLVGQIKSRSWNGCLWVELYDTTTEEDVNIGEELVKQGLALKAESQDSHTDYSSSISYPSCDLLLVPG